MVGFALIWRVPACILRISDPRLSSLLGGVLNGDTLSSVLATRGSRLTLLGINAGFVGTLGFSARITCGGRPLVELELGISSTILRTGFDSGSLFLLSATECGGPVSGLRLSLLGGTGTIRGDCGPFLRGVGGPDADGFQQD